MEQIGKTTPRLLSVRRDVLERRTARFPKARLVDGNTVTPSGSVYKTEKFLVDGATEFRSIINAAERAANPETTQSVPLCGTNYVFEVWDVDPAKAPLSYFQLPDAFDFDGILIHRKVVGRTVYFTSHDCKVDRSGPETSYTFVGDLFPDGYPREKRGWYIKTIEGEVTPVRLNRGSGFWMRGEKLNAYTYVYDPEGLNTPHMQALIREYNRIESLDNPLYVEIQPDGSGIARLSKNSAFKQSSSDDESFGEPY